MTERERIADEMEDVLLHRTLGAWFPRCVEDAGPFGGFHERYDRTWTPLPDPTRSLVFAARMTWVCATMTEGGFPGAWREWTIRGVEHLRDRFHTGEGRFHWRVDTEGAPIGEHANDSVLYGHAFAIFALAAAARTVPESGAGPLAEAAFVWYESAHRDPEFPGSFEIVDAQGRPALDRAGEDELGTPYGMKSQNSPLHLLEALAELHEIAPTETVEARLREAIRLLTDTMFRAPGRLEHQMRRDGSPLLAPATFGHDVEAGHLVLAALARLPGEDEWTPTARERAGLLIRTALGDGFAVDDQERGSLGVNANDGARVSWVQSENLLALATMVAEGEDLMGDLTAQWAWFRDRQVDPEYGGLFGALSPEGKPLGSAEKGGPWKAAYHDTRALLYSARLLRGARVGEDPDRDAPRGY